jgi:RHS repeat-associated protein
MKLEAILFVAAEPVPTGQLAAALDVAVSVIERGLNELDASYEEVIPASGSAYSKIQRVQATPAAQLTRRTATGGAVTTLWRFLHRDHLGSVHVMANLDGTVITSTTSFDPFGGRREKTWASDITTTSVTSLLALEDEYSARGFTDHEHLNRTGFIHMNGRVYDPRIGRFVSPDPIVQAPYFSQSYNRYAYVINNPVSMVDPSGFNWIEISYVPTGDGSYRVDSISYFPTGGGESSFSFPPDGECPQGFSCGGATGDAVVKAWEHAEAERERDRPMLQAQWSAGYNPAAINEEIASRVEDRYLLRSFSSEDDVALYLHDKLYSLSVQHGIEIGARIFRVDSGWSFTLPRTDFKSHEVYAGPVPPGAIGGTAGDWHTHPSGNSFSGMDRHNATFASERDGRTSYVSHMMDGRAVLSQIYFYRPNALTWIGGKWQ